MKKQILITLTLTLIAAFGKAQQLKPNSINRAKSTSFITEIRPHLEGDKTGDVMSIYNSKNIYHNKVPKNRNPDISVERGDKSGILNAFIQVFGDKRLQQLLPERYIQMTFYVNTSGRILEIEFFLDKNTLVTAGELEALEKALKANVWFKLRPSEIKGQDFIDIASGVSYRRILDRTQK